MYHTVARLTLLLLTSIIFLAYIHDFDWHEPRLSLDDFLSGTAHKPYAYRVLLPMLTKFGLEFLPFRAELIASALMYLSLVGFVIALRHLLHSFYEPGLVVDLAIVTTLVALVPLMLTNRHIYDFTTLLLFTFALYLLARSKIKMYLLLFPAITLNKETSIILTLFFAVHFWRSMSLRAYVSMLLAQLVIYAAVRSVLINVFMDNPGGIVEFHLRNHLEASKLAPGMALLCALPLIIVVLLTLADLNKKPRFIRDASLTILPVQLVLYLILGFPFEIRFFYESIPVISIMSVEPLGHLIGISVGMNRSKT